MPPQTISPLVIFPPVLPLAIRAQNDADRLWAEHTFNEPDLLVVPSYLRERPTTSYKARIQMELIGKWQMDIVRNMVRVEALVNTPEYWFMGKRVEELSAKRRDWAEEVERLEALEGGNVVKKEKKQKKAAKEQNTKIKNEPVSPRGIVAPTLAKKAPEQNHGFGGSTRIMPYQAGVKRGADEEEEMTAKKRRADVAEAVAERIAVLEDNADIVPVLPADKVVKAEADSSTTGAAMSENESGILTARADSVDAADDGKMAGTEDKRAK